MYEKLKVGRKVDRYKFKYRINKTLLNAEKGAYWFDSEIFSKQNKVNKKFENSKEKFKYFHLKTHLFFLLFHFH